jgi:hypothetical protein
MSVFLRMTNSANDGVRVLEVAIRNAGDWSAFWGKPKDTDGVANDWAESRITMFLTQGHSTGARWEGYNQLEKKYYVPVKKWVLGVPTMQKGAVLRYTTTPQSRTAGSGPGKVKERLFPAMCDQSSPYFVYELNQAKNVVTMGTSLSYAWNHDQGIGGWTRTYGKKKKKSVTVLTPKRPLTMFGEPFIRKLRERLGKAASNMGGKVGITDAQYAANFKLNGGKIGL